MLSKLIEKYAVFIGAIGMIIGLSMLIFGSKFMKYNLVFIIILASITFCLYAYYYFPIDKTHDYTLFITIGIGFILGILIGYFLIQAENVLFFAIGAYLGYLIGSLLYAGITVHFANTNLCMIITIVITMIIFGIISIKISKHIIIITTSFIGGYLTVRGASLYIGHFPPESVIIELISKKEYDQLFAVNNYFLIFLIFIYRNWMVFLLGILLLWLFLLLLEFIFNIRLIKRKRRIRIELMIIDIDLHN